MTTSRRFSGKLLSGAVLIAALFASAPAASAEAPGRQPVTMRFAFDRSAPADVTYSSLRRAAVRTCNLQGGTIMMRSAQVCAADLIKAAVVKIGDVRIARLHAERTGQPAPMLALARS
jgi:hypothetical protein